MPSPRRSNRNMKYALRRWLNTHQLGGADLALFSFLALLFAFTIWRRLSAADPAAFWFDDYFYYLVPAQNWVDLGVSSFDGATPTNGYHPIWFLVQAVGVAVFGGATAGFHTVIAVTISVLVFASTITCRQVCLRLGATCWS